MEFLVKALFVAFVTWAVGWMVVEVMALFDVDRKPRRGAVSGAETAIGDPAVVTKSFTQDGDRAIRGRVRFEGEDWKAVFTGSPSAPPATGDRVTVVEIDTGNLEVRVK